MDLTELACIHTLETSGRAFLAAVAALLEGTQPSSTRKLDTTTKIFEKDCERMQRQLKRSKICSKQKFDALLCLQRVGLPRETSTSILRFLV